MEITPFSIKIMLKYDNFVDKPAPLHIYFSRIG